MSILCYHTLDRYWGSPLAITPERFAVHSAWLARHRAVADLTAAVQRLDRLGRLPRGMVALTFDDGLAGIHRYAFPVLVRYRLPATVFVVAKTLHSGSIPVDWVDDPPAAPLTALTVEQILEMHAAGIGFGSHGLSHRRLTELSDVECVRELRTSRELLEDLLACRILSLAYPHGEHDPRVWQAARRAGFEQAFTLPEGPEPCGQFAIPRVGVYRGNGLVSLVTKTSRWYLPVRTSRAFASLRRWTRGDHHVSRPPGRPDPSRR